MGWGKKKLQGSVISNPINPYAQREEAAWLSQLGSPPASAPPSIKHWNPGSLGSSPMSPPWAPPSMSSRSGRSSNRSHPITSSKRRHYQEDAYEPRMMMEQMMEQVMLPASATRRIRQPVYEDDAEDLENDYHAADPPFYPRHRKQSSAASRRRPPQQPPQPYTRSGYEVEDYYEEYGDMPPVTPSKHARKPSKQVNDAAEVDDGSQKWTTKSGEALAKVKLQTLTKSVEESRESLFTCVCPLFRAMVYKYLNLTGTALAYLDKLEYLRIVGPRDSRISLPSIFATSLKRANAPLATLALSRVSNIEEGNAFAGSVGRTCISLKLNDCKLPVWRPLLRQAVHLEILEALVPPDGLAWFSRKQWAQMTSLRLGYGSVTALSDLLDSCTAVDDEPVYLTALETLVLSHFAPIPLNIIVRLARTLGTPLVKKLEISRIAADAFEPRVLTNLAAYFEEVEDLRIHRADEGEEELSLQESRKARTKACDWVSGRYGMDDFGLAFAAFPCLRTVEINHARYPFILDNVRSSPSKARKIKSPDRDEDEMDGDTMPVCPDGRPLVDLLSIDARALASKCRSVKRVGYSFPINGQYIDCQVTWSKGSKGLMPTVKPYFSKPKDAHG